MKNLSLKWFRVWLFAFAVGCLAYLAGGMPAVILSAFLFQFFAVGRQYQRAQEAEQLARDEGARASRFQQYAMRRHRRLMRYRKASRARVHELFTIIAAQESIAQIKVANGKIKSLLIDGVLFLPATDRPPTPAQGSPDDDALFDFPHTIGGD